MTGYPSGLTVCAVSTLLKIGAVTDIVVNERDVGLLYERNYIESIGGDSWKLTDKGRLLFDVIMDLPEPQQKWVMKTLVAHEKEIFDA